MCDDRRATCLVAETEGEGVDLEKQMQVIWSPLGICKDSFAMDSIVIQIENHPLKFSVCCF